MRNTLRSGLGVLGALKKDRVPTVSRRGCSRRAPGRGAGRAVCLGLVSLILFASGCDGEDPVGPEEEPPPSVAVTSVSVDEVRLAVGEIRFAGDAAVTSAVSPDAFVSLALEDDVGTTEVARSHAEPGEFSRAEVEIASLDPDATSDTVRASLLVRGTLVDQDGSHPFLFTSDGAITVTEEFEVPFLIPEHDGDLEQIFTLIHDRGGWFRDSDGAWLDPRQEGQAQQIVNGIAESLSLFTAQVFLGLAGGGPDESVVGDVVIAEDRSLLATVLDQNGAVAALQYQTPDDEVFAVALGDDGLPSWAMADEHILVFNNWSEEFVDVALLAPDGTIQTEYNVQIGEEGLTSFLRFGQEFEAVALSAEGWSSFWTPGWTPGRIRVARTVARLAACAGAVYFAAIPVALAACGSLSVGGMFDGLARLTEDRDPRLSATFSGLGLYGSTIVGCAVPSYACMTSPLLRALEEGAVALYEAQEQEQEAIEEGRNRLTRGRAVCAFPDSNLEAAVREAINKPDGDIFGRDLEGLEELSASGLGISSLVGLECATDLVSLNLASNSISDITPLEGLTQLTELHIGGNSISDLIPLQNLSGLTFLRAGSNSISDITSLQGLTELTNLSLPSNVISDLNPLAGLASLQALQLDANEISDLAPLAGLTSLQTLKLNRNEVSDLASLADLTQLDTLWIGHNEISDLAPLAALTGLRNVWLHHNEISNLGPLAGLMGLHFLSLHNNEISNLAPLADLIELEDLWLGHNQVSDLAALMGLTGLEILMLETNRISDLSPLAGLTSVRTLRLQNNSVTDVEPLVANQGLGSGDSVGLWNNPLSQQALCEQIPALKGRGVSVSFDGTCGT